MSNESSQERISQKLSVGSERSKSKQKTIIIVSILAVILVAGVVAMLLLFGQTGKTDKRNVVVTPDNVEETLAQMTENKTQTGTYEVTMNTTWEFENGGSASSNAYVENSTANTNDVYFDLVRTDTEETIFSSPTLPVGSHLENITLDKSLEAGSHDCVLTYHLLDEDSKTVSTLNINVKVNVAN